MGDSGWQINEEGSKAEAARAELARRARAPRADLVVRRDGRIRAGRKTQRALRMRRNRRAGLRGIVGSY